MSTPVPPNTPQPEPEQPGGYPGQQPYGGAPSPAEPYGAYPPPAGGPAYPGYGTPAGRPSSALAIAGLVTALIPCTFLVGLVLSIVALVKASRGTAAGRGLAIAGIVVSVLWLVGGVVAFALGIGHLLQTCAELGQGVHQVDGVTYTCNV
jgi:uncharacterized membrane protein